MTPLQTDTLNQQRRPIGAITNQYLTKYGVVVAFIVLIVLSSILYPGFLQVNNLLNMSSQLTIVGIMSIGMTFVMISGGFDMSVGGIYAASATFLASVADKMPLGLAMFLTIVLGLVLGMCNGILVTKFRVPPFIATLGSGSIITGLALVYSNAQAYFVEKSSFMWLGTGLVGGIPVATVILFFAYLIGGIILAFTTFGRSLYAMGGNIEASRLSGLRVRLLTINAYGISGICASISGIIIASRLGQGSANIGDTIALDVIAAVVIGGTSLSGGEGAMWRTVIGGSVLIILSNVFDSLSMSPYFQDIFKGAIIIGAVMFDYYARSRTKLY